MYPAASASYGAQPGQPIEVPPTVNYAVWAMYAGAAINLIGGIISAVLIPGILKAQLDAQGITGADRQTVEAATGVTVVFAIIIAIVGAGLWVWMALAHKAGQGWARIVATVFACLGLISTLSAFARPTNGLSIVLIIIQLLVIIAAGVLMWMKPNSEYIAAKTAQKRIPIA